MNNIFKISLKNHFRSLKWAIIYLLLSLVLLIYFYLIYGSDGLFILIIFLILQLIPTIYLHYKYYVINRYNTYYIKVDKLEIANGKIKNSYLPSEIEKIIIYKSANLDTWGMPLLTFENYYYTRIFFKDGNNLVLTSLLDNNIEEILKINYKTIFIRKKGFSFFPNW